MGQILDGKLTSSWVKAELKLEVQKLVDQGKRPPHLAAIIVGANPASKAYVRNKIKFCEEIGYNSTLIQLPDEVTEYDLLAKIQDLNNDSNIDGFIVQLPLPKHIDETKVTMTIDHKKDVDGFHPTNFGRMAQGLDAFLPATPFGILELLKRNHIQTKGKHCVVVGRSNIVGTPISILLSRKSEPGNCTVTLTHSSTTNIKEELLRADIIIAAIGIPNFITADMVKEGAIVIDVGINRIEVEDHDSKTHKLVGDVDFDQVFAKAGAITPVPGGVGPMTVTSLMINTLRAYKHEVYPA